jgi:cell division initiation protein
MALAPVEIRHTRLKQSWFGGYRKRATNEFLEQITESFEETWREREDLRDKVELLENELRRHRELETLLRETLLSAERSAIELKEQARTEAELVIREAHTAARSITQDALAQRERLQSEAIRVRALLQAALTSVDESEHDREREPVGAAAEAA